MGFNIGPTITVQGEAQFNAAMVQMRQNMKYVNAEANAAMSIFDKNEKSVESLTAKNETLSKSLAVLRKGEQEAKNQIHELVKNGLDPASDKYKQLKANLDNVTAAANKTEHEIRENKEAMSGLNETSNGLGSAVQGIAGKFGINLPSSMTKSLDSIVGLDAKMLTLAGTFAAVGAIIVKVEAQLISMTLETSKKSKEISTLAKSMGMTTDQYQEWDYVLKSVNHSAEQAQGDLSQLAEKAMDAANGAGEGAELFKKMGIEVTDSKGKLKSQNQIFNEVIESLHEMKDETERNAIASALLSTTGERLVPILNMSKEEISALKNEAHEMGGVLDKDAIENFTKLDKVLVKFNLKIEDGKNKISEGMTPAIERLMTVGSGTIEGLFDLIESSGIVEVFAALLDIVSALGPVFDILFNSAKQGTGPIKALAVSLAIVADALTIVVNLVAIAIEAFKQLFNLMTTGRVDNRKFNEYWGNLKRVFSSDGATARAMNSINSVPRYASGTNFHPGGPAFINDGAGPELVDLPRGSKVYSFEQTKMMLAGAGGGDVFNISINAKDVREFNDVVRMAKSAQQDRRAGR